MSLKVLLGMSGGVDSSVSAILLQKQGYEVIGATMRLWEDVFNKEFENVEENNTINDAKKVCEKLGIEHHTIDLKDEFRKKVVDNFVCTYMCAKTPNPCVECNKYMKFEAFYKFAQELGCEYIATGHYAKIKYSEKYNQYVLAKANAETKDQSYFLYGINKKILPYIIFPLSEFTDKGEIRKIAAENGLDVAQKKDSQEVCFIPNNNYSRFLKEYTTIQSTFDNEKINGLLNNNAEKSSITQPGDIVLSNGEKLGTHNGLINYTVGQRKGLGIAYKDPLYVLKLDKAKNQVIVGTEKELYSVELTATEMNFLINNIDLTKEIDVMAKIRYRAKAAPAKLKIEGKKAVIKFKDPQRAITPGQSVVFYLDDIVLGGGKII